MISASRLSLIWMMVNVEYATCLTLQIGSVAAMVDTQSSRVSEFAIIVEIILAVSVERMLAFTPLPRPSASATMVESSPPEVIST